MSRAASGLPSRRQVLVAGSLLVLAGCLPGGDEAEPPVDPEVRLRARIAAEVRALGSHYDAVIARFPRADTRLSPLAAEHEAHAKALLGPPAPTPSPSASPSGSATAAPRPVVPGTLDAALAGLVAAERAASRRRARQAGRASPALARLLASVAGSEAAHAALLSGRTSAGSALAAVPRAVGVSRREIATLQEVLAAEHAVVFGYGVAGARLGGAARRRAQQSWNSHRAARDALSVLVVELGGEPEAAAATYALPSPVQSTADARALIVLLEERLTAVWADAVLDLTGDLRDLAVGGLRQSAVVAARWRGGSVPFPGLAERA